MTRTPPDRLFEEAAFVAYYLGWDPEQVLDLPHAERRRWCAEVSKINEQRSPEGSR